LGGKEREKQADQRKTTGDDSFSLVLVHVQMEQQTAAPQIPKENSHETRKHREGGRDLRH
jgi:hypothetical protein